MSACQTVATNDAELVASKKEFLLAQSGFKRHNGRDSYSTGYQCGLAQHMVSAVKYNGKLYYVSYADEGQDLTSEDRRITPGKSGSVQQEASRQANRLSRVNKQEQRADQARSICGRATTI